MFCAHTMANSLYDLAILWLFATYTTKNLLIQSYQQLYWNWSLLKFIFLVIFFVIQMSWRRSWRFLTEASKTLGCKKIKRFSNESWRFIFHKEYSEERARNRERLPCSLTAQTRKDLSSPVQIPWLDLRKSFLYTEKLQDFMHLSLTLMILSKFNDLYTIFQPLRLFLLIEFSGFIHIVVM